MSLRSPSCRACRIRVYQQKEQVEEKGVKKGASWYIDQGSKKRDERRGGERQIKGLN